MSDQHVSDQHKKFQQRLKGSTPAVMAVATHFHNKGNFVEIPPTRIAPSASVAAEYVDGGDLFLVRRYRIEVKGLLKATFSSAQDFPYRVIFISNAAAVERAKGEVFAYIVVSADLKCAAIVKAETSKYWTREKGVMSNTGNEEENIGCPPEHAEFVTL